MVQVTEIKYAADDREMVGTLYEPDGDDRRAGVLVLHEGPGLDDHGRNQARRLAELGYVAFAGDYHGGGARPPLAEMRPRLGELIGDPVRTRRIGRAGLDQLVASARVDPSRLAAIGFCFGGTMALELARDGADLQAVVGFHSGLGTSAPAATGGIRAAVLALIGADDPMIPIEQRNAWEDEMRAAGADWQLITYGGAVHSFTNPNASAMGFPGVAYHQPTDTRSWQAMLQLFAERLG